MSLLAKAGAEHRAAPHPLSSSVADLGRDIHLARLALARHCERAQHLETEASTVARAAANRLAALNDRKHVADIAAGVIGFGGLAAVVAAQFYTVVPFDYAFAITLVGVVLAALSLAWLTVIRSGIQGEQATALLEGRIRARGLAAAAKRLGQAAEDAHRRQIWTCETVQAYEWLFERWESETERLGKELGLIEVAGRKHRRIVPKQRKVIVRTSDGRALSGTIADVSMSGVSLTEGLPRMALNEAVLINGRAAVVVRQWENGIAFAFKRMLNIAELDEDLVL